MFKIKPKHLNEEMEIYFSEKTLGKVPSTKKIIKNQFNKKYTCINTSRKYFHKK